MSALLPGGIESIHGWMANGTQSNKESTPVLVIPMQLLIHTHNYNAPRGNSTSCN